MGKAVVAAAFVILLGTFGELLNEALFEEPLDRCIQAAWAEAQSASGALGDIFHNGVAVAIPVGQRNQDVERVFVEGQERIRLRVFRRHAETISESAIADNGIVSVVD